MSSVFSPAAILQTATWNIQETVRRLGLKEDIARRIIEPTEQISTRIHPILHDGQMLHAQVFVVRHNDVLGPAKGGIRMSSTVSLDEITGLAMEMTWKTSLIGVPFGGGKAGIRYDPARLKPTEKEVLIRAFIRGVRRHVGPEIYVPAPDMGTDEHDMGHIRDCISYSGGTSITTGCFVTGKPVIQGGIIGRREATGYGVAATIAAACEHLGKQLSNLRVAIQGFGNVGSVTALTIAERGATVVAVSDISGGTSNEDGLDVRQLAEYVKANGGVSGFPGGEDVSLDDVLEADCDLLIPAAADSAVTEENADRIRAKIIAEAANAPLTPQADEILGAREVFIIPDILCNAGGVFVSYLEYTQETQRDQMTRVEVEQRLSTRMANTFEQVYHRAQRMDETMRHAAMDLAVSRVVEGIIARGFLP
jgi:glutamate dehydrogenase/leucine dehydrogenase